MRPSRLGLSLTPLLLCYACSGGPQADTTDDTGAPPAATLDAVLDIDEAWFWEGETLNGQVPSLSLCDTYLACPSYLLDVAPGGKRLRIGLDTPERTDSFGIHVFAPDGSLAGEDDNFNQFNSEVLIDEPTAGLWRVQIRPDNATYASFRMRAKLESALTVSPALPADPKPLLPNLRTVPPYEFGFVAPANPLNGLYPPDTVNPPLSVAGIEPISCSADEAAPVEIGGAGAVRCLRFTSGPVNVGQGIYDMRFELLADTLAGETEIAPNELLSRTIIGPKTQVVHWTDGSQTARPAGTYSFHPIHVNFHDDFILKFELYQVTDTELGALVAAGLGTKSGFCPADQLFGNWYAFEQGHETPGGDSPLDNCFSPTAGTIGLSVGWGDVYRWQRPGMYVEFDGNPNGRYVVRSIVDEMGYVLETDDSDNVSYAYIEVQGDTIEILERGWGTDPWDDRKLVFDLTGPVGRSPLDHETVTFALVDSDRHVRPVKSVD